MSTTFANTINSNEILAKRSQCDYAGSDIQLTYATKSEVSTGLSAKEDSANKSQSINTSSTTDFPSSKAVADYVASSVSTNTAKFLGNFTLADLSLTYPATDAQIETALDGYAFSPAPTNNDYVYVEIQDPLTPGVTDVVKRFKFDGNNWLYEYALNNSSFTPQEIAAIDSGVNATKVGNYDTHIADATIHVTSSDKTTWNGKQDAISDLQTIRTGAGLGATAVQPGDLATVATSGLYSDLSGTPSLATVATSGDYDDLLNKPTIPAAQVQSDWTEADNTDPSYIQNKPSLATVATSGLYSDLSGTPSLATVATSGDYDDLLNKPSIPAAQVQADWTEADNTDPSYIQNKPSLATVATSGLYSDLSGTPSLATVATSGDYDDLLNKPTIPAAQVQADWTEADNTDPSYIQNKPTLATVATSGLYSDLSGTPTINNVPTVTSSDDNKVLKASYTGGVGSYSWEAESGGTVTDVQVNGSSVVSGGVADITIPAQVQADWAEADNTAASYIENKPVPKTLVAGTGISITETANDLTVASNVTGVDETSLFTSDAGDGSPVLSESPMNFERLKIYFGTTRSGTADVNIGMSYTEVLTSTLTGGRQGSPSSGYLTLQGMFYGDNSTQTNPYITFGQFTGCNTTTWTRGASGIIYNLSTGTASTSAGWIVIYKVIGVNRIAP